MIRLLTPSVPTITEARSYLDRIDENKHYTNQGPLVRELEKRLEEKYCAYVVTVANCTLGLELAYTYRMLAGFRTIELPSLTFPATWLAANRSGLTITPIDVDPHTWIAPGVAGFGVPSYSSIVDAAGAFGEQDVPKGMTAVFSLHATKTLGCGEGGYIVTHDRWEADAMRQMANFGIDESHVSVGPGTNAKMSEYHAAIALTALDRWDREPFLQLYDWYDQYLPDCVVKQKRPRGVYSLLPVKLPVNAEAAKNAMPDIETRRWYCPQMTKHPMFVDDRSRKDRRKQPVSLPVTDDLEQHLLGLPYHLHLKEADVSRICETLERTVKELQ